MGALGVRQKLVGGLALKADAFAVRMMTDASNVTCGCRDGRRAACAGWRPSWAANGPSGSIAMRTRIEVGRSLRPGRRGDGNGRRSGRRAGLHARGQRLEPGRPWSDAADPPGPDTSRIGARRWRCVSSRGSRRRADCRSRWSRRGATPRAARRRCGKAATTCGGPRACRDWARRRQPAVQRGGVPASGGPTGHGGPTGPGDPTGQGGPTSPGAVPGPRLPIRPRFRSDSGHARGWAPDRLAMEVGYGVAAARRQPGSSRSAAGAARARPATA